MEPILLRQKIPFGTYKPRAYLNGFPKSGLHLVEQMVEILLTKSDVGTGGSQWLGTYKWHSWTMIWQDMRRYLWRMSCQQRGTYLMGHSAYHEDVRKLMQYGNIGHIFIYRDLRDVAVSQTHHIMDADRPDWQHAHKDLYKMLGSFDAALSAVIEGLGPYVGLMHRWAAYAPWLECDDVLAFKYQDLRADPARCAARIVLFLMKKATEFLEGNEYDIEIAPEDLKRLAEQMVENTKKPSTTLREGKVGGWREAFKREHIELFKRCDPDHWLVRLGFEDDPDWGGR